MRHVPYPQFAPLIAPSPLEGLVGTQSVMEGAVESDFEEGGGRIFPEVLPPLDATPEDRSTVEAPGSRFQAYGTTRIKKGQRESESGASTRLLLLQVGGCELRPQR